MPKKGEHLDKQHRKAMSLAMKKYWSSLTPEEREEHLENFIGSRRRPELSDLPPQLENPQRIFYWVSTEIS